MQQLCTYFEYKTCDILSTGIITVITLKRTDVCMCLKQAFMSATKKTMPKALGVFQWQQR